MYPFQYNPYLQYNSYMTSPFQVRQQTQTTAQSQSNAKNPYPPIEPETFYVSITQLNSLLRVSATLAYQLNNTDMGIEIMEAAQKGETGKIYEVMQKAGIPGDVKVSYTPYGITFTVIPEGQTGPVLTYASLHLTWQALL